MPADRPPPLDLMGVIVAAASHVIAAIPLKPASRILRMDPAVAPPDGQRLRGVDAKVIKPGIVPLRAEFGVCKPLGGEFPSAVGHVLSTEDPEPQHLRGRQLRTKLRRKMATGRFRAIVAIVLLHQVVHAHAFDHRTILLFRHMASSLLPI